MSEPVKLEARTHAEAVLLLAEEVREARNAALLLLCRYVPAAERPTALAMVRLRLGKSLDWLPEQEP